ncbi:phosphatidylinositol 4-phosphate 5-kinase-like protein 1 isoform X1 [Gadus chalcogrammus]|uniref:phosphatidylinositol 4-phosphate 5-kinase-like protein 1 isoform X1 n=2 Tax=Gadus chalcogrammus TaxID=1042646 RepID=UPI0024C2E0F9|nr:phosphatidylinositol 4-phosphate 5-kinase-like protein 1 isoform X1 [Gadus chalcogrammus]
METEMYGSLKGLSGGGPPRQPSATVKTRRRKRWGGLRQKWKMLGLFPIDPEHEFHGLTCMMKDGLAAAIQSTVDTPPTNITSDEDFKMKDTQIHKGFTLQTYAGHVFASFRSALGMSEREYQLSLCSASSYLQFISNSKSKADFFLTNDKRFFLKTQNKREIRFLLDNLKIYMEHLRKYPHSLLVKFLGVHKIKIPHQKEKYFIVMQSVFYPDDRIIARYDIKGCEVSRWTDPSPEDHQVIAVLKDLNFRDQYIELDQQRAWLLCQMEIDTHFLRQLNVLDYSLLLAHQPLHQDERPRGSFGSLIIRAKRSVTPGSSPLHPGPAPGVPGAVLEDAPANSPPSSSSSSETDGYHVRKWAAGGRGRPRSRASDSGEGGRGGGGGGGDSTEMDEYLAHNRRLLPNFKNPLHVIDGPEQRYFVGIIDIFTVYGLRKRLEHWWKRLRYPGRSFSTVSPPAYRARLCDWVKEHSR